MRRSPSWSLLALLAFLGAPLVARADEPKPPEPPPQAPPQAPPTATRGFVGFSPAPAGELTAADRERLKVASEKSIVVTTVRPGSPAARAGLRVGDVILKYAGVDAPDGSAGSEAFAQAFGKIATKVKVGDEVEIVVQRDGQPVTLKAVAVDEETLVRMGPGALGLTVAPAMVLSPKQREQWHVTAEKGVVAVRVLHNGPAAKAGVRDGDVLLKIGGLPLPDPMTFDPSDPDVSAAFERAVAKVLNEVKADAKVEIVVEREGKPVSLEATAIDGVAARKLAASATEDHEKDEGDEDEEDETEGPGKR